MVVVTGGTGLVGGHLLYHLIKQNIPVRAIIRQGSNAHSVFDVWKHLTDTPEEYFSKIEWLTIDTHDISQLSDAFQGARQVYHCAALVTFDTRYKSQVWEANIELTRNIVNICLDAGVEKMLYLSSVAAISDAVDGKMVSEDSGWPAKPKSIYSQTKTLAELEVWRGIEEGLKAVIINPTIILGSGNWSRSSARIFDSVYKGLRYTTVGATGFVDVHDVVDISLKLMSSEICAERFIVNGANMSYKEVFRKIAIAFNSEVKIKIISPRLLSFIWPMEWLRSRITRTEARLTRQSARAANIKQQYSSKKLKNALEFTFRDIDNTIQRVANQYIKSM